MSASTVSITANQGPTTRRRAVEKNISAGGSDLAAGAVVIETENRDTRLTDGDMAAAILRDARKTPSHMQARKSVPGRKPTKPRWLTVISILTKNIALVALVGGPLVQARNFAVNAGISCVMRRLRDMEDVQSSIEFDRDDELFATAGVSRRIKIFEFSSVLNESTNVRFRKCSHDQNSAV